MYKIVPIEWTDLLPKITELAEKHWEEIGSKSDVRKFAIDEETFAVADASANLYCLAVMVEGKVVGYSVNFLAPDVHAYPNTLFMNDALYVAEEYRRGRVGISLMEETERVAASVGATAVCWHCKPNTPLHKLLEKRDYGLKDLIYMKEV